MKLVKVIVEGHSMGKQIGLLVYTWESTGGRTSIRDRSYDFSLNMLVGDLFLFQEQ